MTYLQRLRRRIAALLRLVLPLGMLGTAALAPGCATVRDAVQIESKDDAIAAAQRAVVIAYDAHAATSRSLIAALDAGAVDRDQAEKLHGQLVTARQSIDAARQLVALGQLAPAQINLASAEKLLLFVARALEAK